MSNLAKRLMETEAAATQSVLERFWSKVEKTDGCWAWTGSRDQSGDGYGYLHFGGHVVRSPLRAHRLSWVIAKGAVPDSLWVLHKCDNPICVNPDHLFLGDRTDNMRDAAKKRRICTIGKSRLTHCKRGHEFSAANTHVDKHGHRRCVTCAAAMRGGRP